MGTLFRRSSGAAGARSTTAVRRGHSGATGAAGPPAMLVAPIRLPTADTDKAVTAIQSVAQSCVNPRLRTSSEDCTTEQAGESGQRLVPGGRGDGSYDYDAMEHEPSLRRGRRCRAWHLNGGPKAERSRSAVRHRESVDRGCTFPLCTAPITSLARRMQMIDVSMPSAPYGLQNLIPVRLPGMIPLGSLGLAMIK